MSDTPRTDAFEDGRMGSPLDPDELRRALEFARGLERELNEAQQQADKWANLAAASESAAVKTHLEAKKAREELEEAQRDAGRWIPVTADSLPPPEDVIVVRQSGFVSIEPGQYVGELFSSAVEDGTDCWITHWRELPAPPADKARGA